MQAPHDALLCPITLQLFRDPVVAQDGHTYERKAIEEWIKKNGTSPITNKQISLEHLYPNYAIKKTIDHFETSLRDKNFQYTLDVDVKKKKGRPLFQTFGKAIYHAAWLPTNDGRPGIILLEIDGARANKQASFYVDLSRHPHIVRTFGLVREDNDDRNSIILLQEYASEGSLYDLLRERKTSLDEKILIEIFLQIIDAMSYLALNHVVHGDLACRNVLVFRFDETDSRNIVVKVTDFGLSRHSKIYAQAASAARTTLNIIPIRYSAPEILSNDVTANDYTEKSDIYSMGVLMWEAYSRGAIPWANVEKDDDVIRHIRNSDTLPQPANCSSQCWAIITKTWCKSPNQRPTFDQLKNLFREQFYQTTTSASASASKSSIPASTPSMLTSKSGNDKKLTAKPSDFLLPKLPPYMGRNSSTPPVSPNVYGQSNQLNENRGAISNTKNQTASDTSFKHEAMLNEIVYFAKEPYTIKGLISCQGKRLFALESLIPKTGYDGKCPQCRELHIVLAPGRGYYLTADTIAGVIEKQKLEKERLQGRKKIDNLLSIRENLPPLNEPSLGTDKDIEGDSGSCYMDATIFCMFAYSNVFDSLLHMKVDNKLLELQTLLRENIVHVLRSKTGFVERDVMFHLRTKLSEATGDQSFPEMEKDPSEFLRALEQLFHYAPLKTVSRDQPPKQDGSNVTTNIIWEMFDANLHNLLSANIVSIFRNSLSEIPAKLATIPPYLVLVAPRHARSKRSYRYIIPDRQITLDNNIVQLVCLECKKTNHDLEKPVDFYSCNDCFMKQSSLLPPLTTDVTIACYCSGCLKECHRRLNDEERSGHNAKKININKHKLNLFAVLCIETSHYVAFVKCQKQDQQHEWLFFDSMSDRIHNEKNVSCVSTVPNFDQWIAEAEGNKFFFEELDKRRNQGKPTSQTFSENSMRRLRLFRDGAFFFYENSSVNYQ